MQALTDVGRVVYQHADDIFGIGRDLIDTLKGPGQRAVPPRRRGQRSPQTRGLPADPAGAAAARRHARRVPRRRSRAAHGQLASYALDVIIANAPAPTYLPVKVFNHLLGQSDTAFFAAAPLAARLKRRFPASLQDAPMVLPTTNSPLRRALEDWFEAVGIRPRVVGAFEDSALMTVVGQAAGYVFPAPAAIAHDVSRFYGVRPRAATMPWGSSLRHLRRAPPHPPGVLAMTDAARNRLFA